RCRANGPPTVRAAQTSTGDASPRSPRGGRPIQHSSSGSLIAHHGHEQVGDAGRAYVAERGELLAIGAIEQEDAAAEQVALVIRSEGPCRGDALGMHRHLRITRLELLHAALEHDAA